MRPTLAIAVFALFTAFLVACEDNSGSSNCSGCDILGECVEVGSASSAVPCAVCTEDGVVAAPTTTECRAAAGDCDVAEMCDGTNFVCPADSFAPSSTECRAAAGDCDVAESCTGDTADCPADEVATTAVECRAANGVCDVAETCDGSSVDCPTDGFADTSVVCRPSAMECDAAETCTGSAPDCPTDGHAAQGVSCDDGNDCTDSDECDGSGPGVTACMGTTKTCSSNGTCQTGVGCVCDEGYDSADCSACATDYQDNDNDMVCTVACSAPTACTGPFACDASDGTATCACDLSALESLAAGSTSASSKVFVSGQTAFVLSATQLQSYDVSDPGSPTLLDTLAVDSPSSIFVAGTTAYIAQQSVAEGLTLVDVSDPANLSATVAATPAAAHDAFYAAGHGFVIEDTAMQVVDLTGATPSLLTPYTGLTGARSIFVANTVAAVAHTNAVSLLEVSTPSSVTLHGTITVTGTAADLFISRAALYIAIGSTVEIYNVATPGSPTSLGTITATGPVSSVFVRGTDVYVGLASGAVEVYDASNPGSPSLLAGYVAPLNGADSNVFAAGDALHVAQSTGGYNVYPLAICACGPGYTWLGGTCVAADAPSTANALVITELMAQSGADEPDRGEWIELFNPTDERFDLEGCVLTDDDTDTHTFRDFGIPAGGVVLIGNGTSVFDSRGLELDYWVAEMTLDNDGDQIDIECNGQQIARHAYGSGIVGQGQSARVVELYLTGSAVNAAFGLEDTLEYGDWQETPLNGEPGAVRVWEATSTDISSFIAWVNWGGTLLGGGMGFFEELASPIGLVPADYSSIRIVFGLGRSQKAHRFLFGSGWNYPYQDYVDVPFEVWDVDNNRQLMVSFRDYADNGVFDLETWPPSREYLFIHAVPYNAAGADANIATTGGQQYKTIFFGWPALPSGATWNPATLPYSDILIERYDAPR